MVRGVQIEINPAKWPRAIILAQDNRDLPIQGDTVAKLGTATFVSFDRFIQQGNQRGLELLGSFVDAYDIFVVGLHSLGNFLAKGFYSHCVSIKPLQ